MSQATKISLWNQTTLLYNAIASNSVNKPQTLKPAGSNSKLIPAFESAQVHGINFAYANEIRIKPVAVVLQYKM